MKSTIKRKEFEKIYKMLDEVSPIDGDCGKLCGAACCSCAADAFDDPEEAMGMYLLPGEDKLFTRKESWLGWGSVDAQDYEFPDSWRGKVYFLACKANCFCDRALRPMQCRTFPLQPHLDEEGRLCLIYDTNELPYKCPLIHEREKYTLNQSWIEATYAAWEKLITDPLIYDLVDLDSANREEDGVQIDIVYTK